MVSAASLSIVSSPSSPFDLPYFNKFTRIIPRTSTNLIKFHPITQSLSIEEDVGSPNRVLVNNSIADFMRFNKGASGELRTIIDSYLKKFPWSLLKTFLQGFIQRKMARILMLDFQLDCRDYELDNSYHADFDFETFKLLQVRPFLHLQEI
ncbi:hypothetical protein Lser_V15G24007 [Lactuca serriola]